MQTVRPTKLQAWVFVAGCGLSSMFGAAATAFSQGPTTVNVGVIDLNPQQSLVSEKHRADDCHDLTIHTAMTRAEVYNWLASPQALNNGEATFVATSAREDRAAGVRFDAIAPRSMFDRIGLKNGDIVHAVQGVPLLSPQSTDRVLGKLLAQDPESVSISLTRYNCPIGLELFL